MEEARRLELDRMLDEAIAAQDGARIKAIRRTMEREVLECTAHTATRIKKIEAKMDTVDGKMDEVGGKLDRVCEKLVDQQGKLIHRIIEIAAKYGGWLLFIIASLLKINLPQ